MLGSSVAAPVMVTTVDGVSSFVGAAAVAVGDLSSTTAVCLLLVVVVK